MKEKIILNYFHLMKIEIPQNQSKFVNLPQKYFYL